GSTIVNCEESDNGDNINLKGTILVRYSNGRTEYYEDRCQNNKFVFEYVCDNNPTLKKTRICPVKCEDGACVFNFANIYNPWRR
ncbi:MAG: hypothetical protein QW331_04835, partial [Candidatus Woesearchaeota archaeon]